MSENETAVEHKIHVLGQTEKRITTAMLDADIVSEQFHVFKENYLTICCLTLRNGSTVIGESVCVCPENFDENIAKSKARANACEQIGVAAGTQLM